jgi:hypothetical protein
MFDAKLKGYRDTVVLTGALSLDNSATSTLVPAPGAGKRIVIKRICLTSNLGSGGAARLQTTTEGTALAERSLVISAPWCDSDPGGLIALPENRGLVLANLGSSGVFRGYLHYVILDA